MPVNDHNNGHISHLSVYQRTPKIAALLPPPQSSIRWPEFAPVVAKIMTLFRQLLQIESICQLVVIELLGAPIPASRDGLRPETSFKSCANVPVVDHLSISEPPVGGFYLACDATTWIFTGETLEPFNLDTSGLMFNSLTTGFCGSESGMRWVEKIEYVWL